MVGKLIELNKTFHGVWRSEVTSFVAMGIWGGGGVGGKRRRPLFGPFLILP